MELLIIFIVVNIINVMISTIKSLVTVKCGKYLSALVNAVAHGFYTIVIVYTSDDSLELWQKVLVVALANLVGVFIVKLIEEKSRKDRLYKVEATITLENIDNIIDELKQFDIPLNYVYITKYYLLNCYCQKKEDTSAVVKVLEKYHEKYLLIESKLT